MIGFFLLLSLFRGRILEYKIEYTETDGQSNYEQSNYGLMNEWLDFKQKQNRKYDVQEDKARYEIFKTNFVKILTHNKLFDEGKVSYKMGVNKFTDLTHEEAISYYTGLKYDGGVKNRDNQFSPNPKLDIAPTVDWRSKNVVTPVKDQGQCGSCYAFSATGSMEGQYAIKNGHLISLSEQNIVDCSYEYGNDGCDGGFMDNCFDYVKHNGGIDTETMYPYKAMEGDCRYKPNPFPLSSHTSIPEADEKALMAAVAQVGPISVGIDVENDFVQYSGGVFYDPNCDSYSLDHGVLVVGYGVENGQDYWLVKNSWGENWGDNGYIKMARNRNNMCGIATSASYPNL